MGWLSEIDIFPQGLQMDVQFAEALLDDVLIDPWGKRLSLSLDALADRYLGRKKEKFEIERYCQGKWPRSKDFRENLWKCPVELVAAYAKVDAQLCLPIIKQQWQLLAREDLTDVFTMECELLPLLVQMRRRGMPIDETAALEARDEMLYTEHLMKKLLAKEAGFNLNVNSSKDIGRVFDKLGIAYERTAKGNPSFTADWLAACDAPIAQQILELRKLIKARGTFIENAILSKAINGKVFPSLHPLRTDDGGTVSGRYSCSQPNGQQIPKRDAEMAPIIRGIFIPEAGYTHWASLDLSQIEYRFFAHFSGHSGLISAYQDPNTDFHQVVAELVGGNFPRVAYKSLNFGLLYGMGKKKLTSMLASLFPEEANPEKMALHVYNTYMANFPAAQNLLKKYASEVSQAPHEIRTILGRKSRFKLWEPAGNPGQVIEKPLPISAAQRVWGRNIRISGSYKAVNRKLQGSAADLLKSGMLDAYKSGLFKKIGYPHITVHDELCLSYHPDLHDGFRDLQRCVENTLAQRGYELNVPIVMGLAIGPNWGEVKDLPTNP
jgi:DNA polymerase-1